MKTPRFDFLSLSAYATTTSLILSLVGLVWIILNGFNYGIDFAGGNEIQIRFQQVPAIEELRKYLSEKGFTKASVQSFGDEENEFLILTDNKPGEMKQNSDRLTALVESLKTDFTKQGIEIRRVDSVGPQIGAELRQQGILAVFYSLILILIYLALRFDYRFAPAAVICLFHDAVITMWIFTVFDLVVNVQTLAALLAIIGYSLNDTIVTFDRIRENVDYFNKKKSFLKICNRSINDVLSRTILTSFTTMIAVGAMWLYTDGVIKDFAFTLGIGVLIGTYSSSYVATPLVVFIDYLQRKKKTASA